MAIDYEQFNCLLGSEFPEVVSGISEYARGLLHPEVGAFRRITEEAIDGGRLWAAERYFRFLVRVLRDADPDVRNAIEVSFLEDFALGEFTPARYEAVKRRMPRLLRDMLIAVDDKWR
jgi:hypothetical protein